MDARLLPGWEVDVLAADDYPPETGHTYYDNALAKARFGRGRAPEDVWVLGEDSGLEVAGLDGGPGVQSSRSAAGDEVGWMLQQLEGVEGDGRRARYVCELVALGPQGEELRGTGTLEGHIATKPAGGEYPQGTWGLAVDGNGIDNIDRNYQVWMTSNGGETYDVEKMRYTLDDPKTIDAYDFLVKLVNDHKVMLGPTESTEFAKSVTGERFVSGAIGFCQESTGRLALYQQQIGNKFEWDVVPFPTGSKSLPFVGHSDADTTQVYAKGKSLDAAYSAAKFIGGDVMQKIMAENKLLIPALRKAAEDKTTFLKAPPKHMDAFLDPLKSGLFRTSFYHHNGLQALGLQADQMKLAMARQKTAREAMLEANRASNDVVKYGNCRQAVTWKKK